METRNGFGFGATMGKLVFGVMVMLFFLFFCTGGLHAGQKLPSENIQASPDKKNILNKSDVPLSVGSPKVTRAEPNEVEIQIPRNGTGSKKTVLLKGVRLNLIKSLKIRMSLKGGPWKHAPGINASMENQLPTKVTVDIWADQNARSNPSNAKYRLDIITASGKRQIISIPRIIVKR